jgi:hypothetical protein
LELLDRDHLLHDYISVALIAIHKLSAVRSDKGARWFYNAAESDGKVSEEGTYLAGCFPTPVGEPIIDSDIDLGILLYLSCCQSLGCGKRK